MPIWESEILIYFWNGIFDNKKNHTNDQQQSLIISAVVANIKT